MPATRLTPRGWLLSLMTLALVASATGRPYASDKNPNLDALKTVEQKTLTLAPPLVEATVGLSIVGGAGMGSGVIVSEDGLIMTAGHVVPGTGKDMLVHFSNGKTVKAKALGADKHIDSGLAQITVEGKWPHVKIGKSSELKKGDWVIAIGNPGGFRTDRRPPIRLGRVLSLPDKSSGGLWIQTDATVAPGDSGGPLFNLNGEVVGIHSNISPDVLENRHVASDDYRARWESMKAGKQTGQMFGTMFRRRGELGVQPEDADSLVKIAEIVKDSPADKAGLKVGDIILSLDGRKIDSADEFRSRLRGRRPSQEVKVAYERDGEEDEVAVKLQDGPYVIQNPPDDLEDFLKKNGAYKLKDKDNTYEFLENPKNKEEFTKLRARFGDQRMRMAFNRIDKTLSKSAPKFLEAVATLSTPTSKSVAQIFDGNDDKALIFGTVVSKDGYILTKASELKNDIWCRIDNREFTVKVIAKREDYDLALLKVDADNLAPVKWSSQSEPTPGSLLFTPSPDGKTLALGIVSHAVREIGPAMTMNRAVLGIQFANGDEPKISVVTPDGPAAKAGLKSGDIILSLDGKAVTTREKTQAALKPKNPGDKVKIEVRRGEETHKFEVTLAASRVLFGTGERAGRSPFGTPSKLFEQMAFVSSRKEDFPKALTHDSFVKSSQCGGPIVNLAGQVVGMNIARFDRTGTYALTYETIKPILEQMLKEAGTVTKTGTEKP